MHSEDKKNNSERICWLVDGMKGEEAKKRERNVKVFTWNTFPTIYILNDTQKNKRIILYDNFMVQKILYPWEIFLCIFQHEKQATKVRTKNEHFQKNSTGQMICQMIRIIVMPCWFLFLLNNIFIYAIIFQIFLFCCCWVDLRRGWYKNRILSLIRLNFTLREWRFCGFLEQIFHFVDINLISRVTD